MKKIFLVIFLLIYCSDSRDNQRNPFIKEVSFRYVINLDLPRYNGLLTPGSGIYIDNNIGVGGVFVIGLNQDVFYAWEALCPNHNSKPCSKMIISNDIYCKCSCENYTYNLLTGLSINNPLPPYQLLPYNVSRVANSLIISN